MMIFKNGFLVLFALICFRKIDAQKKTNSNQLLSPCSSNAVIQKVMFNGPPGKRNTWDGTILLQQWPNYPSFVLKIVFDRSGKFQLLNNNGGKVESIDGRTYQIKYLTPSNVVDKIRFEMKGKPNAGFPNITGVYLNNIDICNVHLQSLPQVKPQLINPNIGEWISTGQPENFPCGTRQVLHEGLITNGYPSKKGDWPWHAALFLRKNQNSFSYICGGSLISKNTVITAAHCVVEDGHIVVPERIFIKLGLYNRLLSDENTQEFQVYKIFTHNDFSSNSYKHDISLLKLSKEVHFTHFVLPICLWPNNDLDIDNLVGKKAIGIGWGYNEHDELSDILTQAEIPVVSFNTCLNSNRDFFGLFLSENNFCAGYNNGTNVCNGDSGGGLVFKMNGAFYLRGMVSVAVVKENQAICNPNQYVLFTDVAKYNNWITSIEM